MKNTKAIIFSVAMCVLGIGIMGLSTEEGQMKSIGGGFFLIGIISTAYFFIHELKK